MFSKRHFLFQWLARVALTFSGFQLARVPLLHHHQKKKLKIKRILTGSGTMFYKLSEGQLSLKFRISSASSNLLKAVELFGFTVGLYFIVEQN